MSIQTYADVVLCGVVLQIWPLAMPSVQIGLLSIITQFSALSTGMTVRCSSTHIAQQIRIKLVAERL